VEITRPTAERISLELIGNRVDVVASGSGAAVVARAIESAWDRCLAAPATPVPAAAVLEVVLDDDFRVLAAARERHSLSDHLLLPLMSRLSSALTLKAIELQHGRMLLLHACALADPHTGNAVVLIAPSGTGKTTAAIALGKQLGYLTDETAAIGVDDVVFPYPKPLSVIVKEAAPKHQISASALGLMHAPDRSRVTGMALLQRVDTEQAPRTQVVPTLEALAAVAAQSSAIQLLPRPLHLLAELFGRIGGVRRITYHEIGDAAPLIRKLTRGAPA
jgi:hypothetical protein